MKILFIVPTSMNKKQMYLEYPLGVGYICTYLRRAGYDTLILDQNAENFEDSEVVRYIETYEPNLIAFSIMTPCYPRAKRQINEIKYKFSNIPIVAGGIHVSLFKQDLFIDNFDALVVGDGEFEFQKFCLVFNKYGLLLSTKQIFINPQSKFSVLSNFPNSDKSSIIFEELILDRNVFNLKLYKHHSLMAARGCPYRCKFCCNYKKDYGMTYVRSVNSVIEELIILEKSFNARHVFFADDIFFTTKKNITKFCLEYKKAGLTCTWVAQLRVNNVDDSILNLMKKSGCEKICLGVESGSQKILDDANKRISIDQIKHSISAIKKSGIRVKTFWILGLPGSYTEQLKSLDLMLETKPNEISIHLLIPFPGTDYYENSEKYGIHISDKNNFESFCYGGINTNFSFDYLNDNEIGDLFRIFSERLEMFGYVSSDKASSSSQYVYSTPESFKSMRVFK
ncbi:MAG: radical SAM protein [Succinimonas sp.]|nr:radical SAM protein [Succinimonas sp.]